MSHYIHSVPGRLRVKIPAIKHRPYAACKVENLFEHLEGITSVQAKALTGSLKISYDPESVDLKRLLNILSTNGYIDSVPQKQNKSSQYAVATRLTQACGKALINWAVSKGLESRGLGLLAVII
jgi:hypothetical protein